MKRKYDFNCVKDIEPLTCKISKNGVSNTKHLSDKFIEKTGDCQSTCRSDYILFSLPLATK